MPQPSRLGIFKQVGVGFISPLDSLKFLMNHKALMVLGLAPTIAGLVGYFYLVHTQLLPWVTLELTTQQWFQELSFNWAITQSLVFVVYLLAFLVFNFIGMPLVNIIASPLFDVIASKALEEYGGQKLPKLSFFSFLESFLSQIFKAMVYILGFMFVIWLPALAPLTFLASIWFFGWDQLDRSLGLCGLPVRSRILYGVRHSIACMSLGVWLYIPFAGTLLTFVMSGAGAITVVKTRHVLTPKN